MGKTHNRAMMARDRYLELVKQCPLRPIRTEGELDRATAAVNALAVRDDLDQDEHDYLDVLSDLIEKYENAHHGIPPLSDADMLRELMSEREMTQSQLARESGITLSTISAILAGRRKMTRRHIEVLARYFHVAPSVFLGT